MYYINKTCYGQSQKGHELTLLSSYWKLQLEWNRIYNKSTKPSVEKFYLWLLKSVASLEDPIKKVKLFDNIGLLMAFLICGNLVEAGILSMPSIQEWAGLIHRLGKGAKAGMEMFGLMQKDRNKEEVCNAFMSLDLSLQHELQMDEKDRMGYNIIMLEHVLCKIKQLTTQGISKDTILSEI